uniref:Uncharacterized protein n=1 Tax=Meloidogyne enterolobii TaxID=390850 RepID=A0A6V7XIL3_MELEN|nr:unnamed protein product [Meloidogyne enterolobii]
MTLKLVILYKERIIRGIAHILIEICVLQSNKLLVEQGCGDSPKEVKDIQYAVCDKPLCNTKELFDKTLFCFIKDSQKEKYKKALKQCDKECFVFRDANGHLWKGCDSCKGKDIKDCYVCKTDYCNEEKHVYKQCLDGIYDYSYHGTNPKTCKNKYKDYCYSEIIENNKVKKGCGKCSNTTCVTCSNGHRCNDKLDFRTFCMTKNGNKKCKEDWCYIAPLDEREKGKIQNKLEASSKRSMPR